MRIKNNFIIIILSVLFTINAGLTLASNEGDYKQPDEKTSDWYKNSKRKRTRVSDGFDINVESGVTTVGIGYITGNVKIKVDFVDCCKPFKDPDSWCNAALQDKRC